MLNYGMQYSLQFMVVFLEHLVSFIFSIYQAAQSYGHPNVGHNTIYGGASGAFGRLDEVTVSRL
jgi:hypothetical protein